MLGNYGMRSLLLPGLNYSGCSTDRPATLNALHLIRGLFLATVLFAMSACSDSPTDANKNGDEIPESPIEAAISTEFECSNAGSSMTIPRWKALREAFGESMVVSFYDSD